jgi:light-regulated signal transduction histidine kinase (bacteriophytochrome)
MSLSMVDMDNLVNDARNEILAANQERDLEFRISNILPVYGDSTLLRQVLINLLSNAVKFTKNRKPGLIEISSCKEGDNVVYRIKDNGAGFNMDYSEKLFGVFQRLHSGEEYEGTGVGLAIVQRIVRRHGGDVWAEAEEDKGATFNFSLPAGSG